MRILVCLENDYRTYREVIAAGIDILRPHTEVVTAELDVLKEEVRHFDPHLMICSLPPFFTGSARAYSLAASSSSRSQSISSWRERPHLGMRFWLPGWGQ